VGDVQLEITEDFLSEVMDLPLIKKKWFNNSKLEEVPWSMFVTSWKIQCCEKGIPISLLKDRWHGLLVVLRKFVTCEGRYGLVFLYHIRLLMHFIGFQLNIPFYLLSSLYKMAKRYKRQSLNSSLFHHGLIRLLLSHHLKLQGDDRDTFLTRNGFITSNPVEMPVVDKPMLEKLHVPSSDRPVLLCKEPCDQVALDEPMFKQQGAKPRVIKSLEHEQYVFPNTIAKTINRHSHKLSKNNSDIGFNNKRARRLISRSLRNKNKVHVSSIKEIDVHERSNSEIKMFLAREDPNYHKLDLNQTYNFVDNLPPCLKHNEYFPRIKLCQKPIVDSGSVLTHSHVFPQPAVPDI
jgi:hypothetical protein